jgi:hypothetical protein
MLYSEGNGRNRVECQVGVQGEYLVALSCGPGVVSRSFSYDSATEFVEEAVVPNLIFRAEERSGRVTFRGGITATDTYIYDGRRRLIERRRALQSSSAIGGVLLTS